MTADGTPPAGPAGDGTGSPPPVVLTLFDRDDPQDGEQLAHLLAGEAWPFHSGGPLTVVEVLDRVRDGWCDGPGIRTYWIGAGQGDPVGVVRVWDIGDGAPLFDLRLRAAHRGRGIGRLAVRDLTRLLFEDDPELERIEATTRQDNTAMRRVLEACGYVKEAHYRRSWPTAGGDLLDTVGYGVLRGDWAHGRTTPVRWDD